MLLQRIHDFISQISSHASCPQAFHVAWVKREGIWYHDFIYLGSLARLSWNGKLCLRVYQKTPLYMFHVSCSCTCVIRILHMYVTHSIDCFFCSLDPDCPGTSIDTVNIPTPHLEKLWTYICPLTKRRKVTCMAWNPINSVSAWDTSPRCSDEDNMKSVDDRV